MTRLLAEPARRQWQLFDLFVVIANDPLAAADLTLRSGSGELVEVRVFADTLVHYHVDHAMKNVLVLDYEVVAE